MVLALVLVLVLTAPPNDTHTLTPTLSLPHRRLENRLPLYSGQLAVDARQRPPTTATRFGAGSPLVAGLWLLIPPFRALQSLEACGCEPRPSQRLVQSSQSDSRDVC